MLFDVYCMLYVFILNTTYYIVIYYTLRGKLSMLYIKQYVLQLYSVFCYMLNVSYILCKDWHEITFEGFLFAFFSVLKLFLLSTGTTLANQEKMFKLLKNENVGS